MKTIKVYANGAGWIYQVWIDGRCSVVGSAPTKARARYYAEQA
jgi:hypothetical protein